MAHRQWLRTRLIVRMCFGVDHNASEGLKEFREHRHRLLLSHLPGLDPSISCAAGTCIAETVGKVEVELRETRLEN